MESARVHDFGKAVRSVTMPSPEAADGETLVYMDYAGVNPLDVRVAQGMAGKPPLPLTLGCEGAGRTPDGEHVLVYGAGLGVIRDGTYAEVVSVPNDAMVSIPRGLDSQQAAAVGIAGVTAWDVVNRVAEINADDRVLVLGASGGVGSIAVQLARTCGAKVWAQTSSASKRDWLGGLSAEVIVADDASLMEEVRGLKFSVVLDALGGPYTTAAVSGLRPRGRHVLYGTSAGRTGPVDLLSLYRKAIRLQGYGSMMQDTRDSAAECLKMLAAGELTIPIDTVFPLDQAEEAHRRISERSVQGKVLLGIAA